VEVLQRIFKYGKWKVIKTKILTVKNGNECLLGIGEEGKMIVAYFGEKIVE
jgi:hypothetical protein